MVKIQTPTAMSMNNVCSVSVHTIVLIPPLNVYNQINKIVRLTVTQKGIPNSSNNSNCNTLATKNNRNAAPMVLDNKKNDAPVL